MYLITLWLGLSFGCIQAWGEANSVSNTSTTNIGEIANPIAHDSDHYFQFQIRGSQYLNQGQVEFREGAANSNNSYLLRTSGEIQARNHNDLKLNWDLETEYSGAEHWNYVRPREAYVSYGDLSFGRRKFAYSNWEDEWNYGLFESRFTDDKLHTSKAGLIGLFYGQNRETFNWRVGALPIYVPDFGPHFYIGDQKFRSYNPWFHPPQGQFAYSSVDHQIEYSVNEPDAGKVIGKPGGMAQVEWKPTAKTFSRFSYAYKPMPQYLESFPVDRRFNLDTGNMEIELNPRFLYHHAANLDWNYQGEKNELGLSVAGEHPVQDAPKPDWEMQNITDAFIVSAYHRFSLTSSKDLLFSTSIFKVWGGDLPDKGPIATSQTVFERRFCYTEAASVGLRKVWRASRLNSGLKVLYDRMQNGFVYSGDFNAQIFRSMTLSLAFDLLQVLPGEANIQDGFLDVYRGNDRVSLGMSYVF